MDVGTPAQTLNFLLDTSIKHTAIPLNTCTNCASKTSYNPSKSKTSKEIDASAKNYLSYDTDLALSGYIYSD